MNLIYNSIYDINNFYYFTPQYFLLKSNTCININFFFFNFFFFDLNILYRNNFNFLNEISYLNYNYINESLFPRINGNEPLFWFKGYNWLRDEINLEYSFNHVIKNGKPRFFNTVAVAQNSFSSNDNYWMLYSLYINNYYNLEDIFSITLRPVVSSKYLDYIREFFPFSSFNKIIGNKSLTKDGFYFKDFNYYYHNTIATIIYDYNRVYGENSNFEFLYDSKFKRFFKNKSLFFSSSVIDSTISEYMLKTYNEVDKQIKNYLFYEVKPYEFGFNSLKIYGYFLKDNLKLENGYQFELYNNILFDLISETVIPSKYNYQSIINQFFISNKEKFKDYQESFVHMSEYKHLIYGLNRYYPTIKGKLIPDVSEFTYLELGLPKLAEYKAKIELELLYSNNIKLYINNYNFIKNSKYYLLDFSFFKKLINNIDYSQRYNVFCNNLSYMDYQLNHAITCSFDGSQEYYEQVKEHSMRELHNDSDYLLNLKKIYHTFDGDSFEDYYEFLIPEGWTVFQDLGLPYENLVRDNYYLPVKSYIFVDFEGLEFERIMSDIFFEAADIFDDWQDVHNVEQILLEEYLVESGLVELNLNTILNYSRLEDSFVKNYISLDENFLELDFRDVVDYAFFGEAELLINKVGDHEDILDYLLNTEMFDETEMNTLKTYFEVEGDSFSEIEQSNDKLLEFFFG